MENCIVRIRHLMEQLTPAEQRVAEYLLQHSAEAVGLPIVELAGRCQTSTTR